MATSTSTGGRQPTTDQLRKAIDRGKLGDKVNFPDPAAAPLGTDDEAAGTAASGDEVSLAAETEQEGYRPPRKRNLMPSLLALIGVVIIMAVVIFLAMRT